MESLLRQIEHCLLVNMHHLAVVTTLTLPDICAAVESENGQTDQVKYENWYNRYLATALDPMTSKECWQLRCGVIHQGKFSHDRMQYSRVIFTLPDARERMVHKGIFGDVLQFDAEKFCRDVIKAVRRWANGKRNDPIFVRNSANLVQYRQNGLSPMMEGFDIIA